MPRKNGQGSATTEAGNAEGPVAGQERAGSLAVYAAIAAEVLVLGALLTAYAMMQARHQQAFAAAHALLSKSIGAVLTSILLAASLAVALAMDEHRSGRTARSRSRMLAAVALGGFFLLLQAAEYALLFRSQLLPGYLYAYSGGPAPFGSLFFSLFYLLTGLLNIYLTSAIIFSILWLRKREQSSALEMIATQWHFTVIARFYVFAVLYLIV